MVDLTDSRSYVWQTKNCRASTNGETQAAMFVQGHEQTKDDGTGMGKFPRQAKWKGDFSLRRYEGSI